MRQFPAVDLFSFVFGFVIAILFLLALWQILKLKPRLKEISQNQKERQKQNKLSAIEHIYRVYMLKKCQRMHLAAALFPLNEIYVDLKLQSHIMLPSATYSIDDEPLIYRHLIQSNGFPELLAGLPLPLISLGEALSGDKNIAVMNEIGCGKTTLLAHFASEILENKCDQAQYNLFLPLFLHINEIVFNKISSEEFFIEVVRHFCRQESNFSEDPLSELFANYLSKRQLLLILDGLDELQPDQFETAVNLITKTLKQNPQLRIVLSLGPSYSLNLSDSGFAFLSLPFPDESFRFELTSKWLSSFSSLENSPNSSTSQSEYKIASLWSNQEELPHNVFEQTIAIWNHLSTDFSSSKLGETSVFIERLLQKILPLQVIEKIALEIANNNFSGILPSQFSKLLDQNKTQIKLTSQSRENYDSNYTSDQLLNYLIDQNLLHIFGDSKIYFSNPSIFAHILAQSTSYIKNTNWKYLLASPLDNLITRLSGTNQEYILDWVSEDDPILYRNILLSVHHFNQGLKDAKIAPLFFQKLLPLIRDDLLPLSIRIQFFSAFLLSDSISLKQIFKFFLESPQISLNQIAAFHINKCRGFEYFNLLVSQLSKKDFLLNIFVCKSLYEMWTKQSKDQLLDLLLNGDEDQRRIVTEFFALKYPEGHDLLREYSRNDNILCRKAVISGLRLISDNWAKDLISVINTEDSQWYVRDAALHALENPYSHELYIPQKLVDPWESAWLISFASQSGLGLPPGVYPYDLFGKVIISGTLEEQFCVLNYLSERFDPITHQMLTDISITHSPIRDAAFSILNLFSQSEKISS